MFSMRLNRWCIAIGTTAAPAIFAACNKPSAVPVEQVQATPAPTPPPKPTQPLEELHVKLKVGMTRAEVDKLMAGYRASEIRYHDVVKVDVEYDNGRPIRSPDYYGIFACFDASNHLTYWYRSEWSH